MKLVNLKTRICIVFSAIKRWVQEKYSKMSKVGKIVTKIVAAISFISSVATLLAFATGKNVPDLITPAATVSEDPITEDSSDKKTTRMMTKATV